MAPTTPLVVLTAEDIHVKRNWGPVVTAQVREPSGRVHDWVLGMDVALSAGCEIPPRPDVVAHQPSPDEGAVELAARAPRVPFYRRMQLPKRGKKRRAN